MKAKTYTELIKEQEDLTKEISETKDRLCEEKKSRHKEEINPLEERLAQAEANIKEGFSDFIVSYGFEQLEELPWNQDVFGGLGNRLRKYKDFYVKKLVEGKTDLGKPKEGTLLLERNSEDCNILAIFPGEVKAIKRYFPNTGAYASLGAGLLCSL